MHAISVTQQTKMDLDVADQARFAQNGGIQSDYIRPSSSLKFFKSVLYH